LADIVLGRRTTEEALDYVGMDPEPEVVDYVNTRISNLQERPEFQEYLERYRGLNEPYDPTEFIYSRSVTGREGSTIATFRSPIPDILNQIEFPNAGIKGSQLLKTFQDSPSVRGSELRSLGVNIDPQKRYSEEEARRLFEGRLWTATASLQQSPIYGGYQRQQVLDPVVDYFELTVNANRPLGENFNARVQHFNLDTLSHTRASVREDSRGEYILPEEFQSDLLQQGFRVSTEGVLEESLARNVGYTPDNGWDDYISNSNFVETLGDSVNTGSTGSWEGGEEEFFAIHKALEDVLGPDFEALRAEAGHAVQTNSTLPDIKDYIAPRSFSEPPIQKTEEGVRLAFDGLLAEAQRRGIDRIIIPPFERIVAERFRPGSVGYLKALQPTSGFYATYKKALDKVLKEYETEFGRENFNTRLVDMDYEPVSYIERGDILDELVDPSSSSNYSRRVVELPVTGIEVNFKGALDAGYDFSSPRFAEGGLVQNYNSGGVVSMEEQMSLFDMGGLTDDGAMRDPVSGNDVPPGSMATEVRDDVPAMLSEGEYIVPADVVRYYGVKFFEDLRGQAKSGMMDMERNGRIGGEPVGAPEDDLTPEEMQMLAEITGMYAGGMVKGYQEGGVVDQPFTPIPNYNIPGFSLFQPTQTAAPVVPTQTQNVTLYGPNGEVVTLTLPTDQERYNQLLAQGYTTQPRAPTGVNVAAGGGSDSGTTAPTTPTTGGGRERDYQPLDPDDYNALLNDPLKFGADALEGKDLSRILGGLGSFVLGPLGSVVGGGIGAGMTAQNVAQARAASQIAKAKGLDTTELDKSIETYVSSLPNLSRGASELLGAGDKMAERFFQTGRDLSLPGSQYGVSPFTRDFFAPGAAGDEAFKKEMETTAPPGMVYDPTVGAGRPSLTYNEQTKKFEDQGETLPGGGYVRPEGESAAPITPTVRPVQRPPTRPDGTPVPPPTTTTPAPSTPPPSDDRDDDRDSGTDTNVGNYGGDRDGDGVPNWRDFNDGTGWADNNKDESKDTSGACFLTTAVVEMRGEEDDGYTLSTLRKFRDTYLRNKNDAVEKYYEVAPKLVKAIPKEDKTWLWIGRRVDKAIEYIEEGKNGLAYQTYKRMVEKLARDWLKEE
jgi:hypothetical protein